MFKINTKKGDKCPICTRQITGENCWVRYHVRYFPEIQILACKFCNFIENKIRNRQFIPFEKRNPYQPNRPSRSEMVINFHEKIKCPISVQ